MVDSHSKPSAAQALFQLIQGVTKQPICKLINTYFHYRDRIGPTIEIVYHKVVQTP